MSNFISGSCFMRASSLRVWLGLMLAGLFAAAQAAQPDEDYSANLLTTRFEHSGNGFLPAYQFNASVVLVRPAEAAAAGSGSGNTFQSPSATNPQQGFDHPINASWQQAYDGDRVSLQRLLRIEFKGKLGRIKLRPRSVSIEGEQIKVTFRPQSALIEGERLKVMLQPRSVSMMWSTAF